MKLRIFRDSLRFRLTPAEVSRLDETGTVVETADFVPEAHFSYSLRTRADIPAMRARLESRAIYVEIPATLVHDWKSGDAVGLHNVQALADGKRLEILVEKDFECLEPQMNPPGEVFYPNPNKNCAVEQSNSRR